MKAQFLKQTTPQKKKIPQTSKQPTNLCAFPFRRIRCLRPRPTLLSLAWCMKWPEVACRAVTQRLCLARVYRLQRQPTETRREYFWSMWKRWFVLFLGCRLWKEGDENKHKPGPTIFFPESKIQSVTRLKRYLYTYLFRLWLKGGRPRIKFCKLKTKFKNIHNITFFFT